MIPEVLKREIQHFLERVGGRVTGGSLRDRLNLHPMLILSVTGICTLLLILMLAWMLRPASAASRRQGKTAWFYDTKTGRLFQDSSRKAGPIAAPSGSAPSGGPAGFRAHVYSYVLDPNESELFAGFLERPDPDAERKHSTAGTSDFPNWTQGHLIRRPKDKQWVRASSPEGQVILEEQTRPDRRGRTPIYQAPDGRRRQQK
jgi:hypothetical protein